MSKRASSVYAAGLLVICGLAPLDAAVNIISVTPSVPSPQPLGTAVTWTVKATDSNPNSLTFQFNVAAPNGTYALIKDFNIGTLTTGTWTAQPFIWTTIAGEGSYTIQVIAKDFITGETATQTAAFQLTTRVSAGVAVVHKGGNPLVALFSAPACAAGSAMRIAFHTGSNSPTYTSWAPCNPPVSMNFYVAGMLPTTTYSMYSQTVTNSKVTNGSVLSFTTGALPSRVPSGFFPTFTSNPPTPSDTANPMVLWSFTKVILPVATDLEGNIMWFYGTGAGTLLTRPTAMGTLLTIENGTAWNTTNTFQQFLREIDLAGNVLHETNTGAVANQLLAMGVTDATPCGQLRQPPQVGDACLNDFHHDAIRLPNGNTAFLAHVEKLFPPGSQGSTSADPVDILSEMVVVLNPQWQVVWYYDTFNQLSTKRAAILGETCGAGDSDCPTTLFLGKKANDWTHSNTIDYVAYSGNPDAGDLLVSVRNQDWVIRIGYKDGAGVCAPAPAPNCIVWYMGPPDDKPVPNKSFTFVNISNDPWPWFSHQHDVTYASSGAIFTRNGLTGPMLTIFDNGTTRLVRPPLGLGSTGCGPNDCRSRGMALIVDETNMTVTPVLMQNLGVNANALGGAQILTNGNFFFSTGIQPTQAIEIQPSAGMITGTQILNLESVDYAYRAWQMPDLYNPPAL